MSDCSYCNGKGYIESTIAKTAQFKPMLLKCPNPNCSYHSKYYQTIRDRYSEDEPTPEFDKLRGIDASNIIIDDPLDPDTNDKPIDSSLSKKLFDHFMNRNSQNQSKPTDSNSFMNRNSHGPLKESPGPSQVPPEQPEPKAKMEGSKEFPMLPQQAVDSFRQIAKNNPNAALGIDTSLGPYYATSLEEANRVLAIFEDYYDHAEEMEYADSLPNVIPFPLDLALGFDEV